MIGAGVTPRWSAQVHTDCARHTGLLPLMRRAGCNTGYVGFESINPEALRLYDKAQTIAAMERAVGAIQEAGICVHGMFVFGSDADTEETIRETAGWAKTRGLDTVQFLILTRLPGTRVYENLQRTGRLHTGDWPLYDTHHVVFRPSKMSAYALQMETLRAQGSFYSVGRSLSSAVSGQGYNALIRLYAGRHNRVWRRTHEDYLEQLRGVDRELQHDGGAAHAA